MGVHLVVCFVCLIVIFDAGLLPRFAWWDASCCLVFDCYGSIVYVDLLVIVLISDYLVAVVHLFVGGWRFVWLIMRDLCWFMWCATVCGLCFIVTERVLFGF